MAPKTPKLPKPAKGGGKKGAKAGKSKSKSKSKNTVPTITPLKTSLTELESSQPTRESKAQNKLKSKDPRENGVGERKHIPTVKKIGYERYQELLELKKKKKTNGLNFVEGLEFETLKIMYKDRMIMVNGSVVGDGGESHSVLAC